MGMWPRWHDRYGKTGLESEFQWEYIPGEGDEDGRYTLIDAGTERPPGPPSSSGQPRRKVGLNSDSVDISATGASDGPSDSNSTPIDTEADRLNYESDMIPEAMALVPARENAQTRYLRHNLDTAVERWRSYGEAPSSVLTRRGLEALADGVELSPDQRSLLLRSALHYESDVITALRFQDDPELTALILAEALTTYKAPITPETVLHLRDLDPQASAWFPSLLYELRYAASSSDVRMRRCAVDALWRLRDGPQLGTMGPGPVAERTTYSQIPTEARSYEWPQAFLIVVAITVASVAIVSAAWLIFGSSEEQVVLPAGQYAITSNGETRQVATSGFAIQRYEVTNREYRRCVATKQCSAPGSGMAGAIVDYFTNPDYDAYPAVNVTYTQAAEYCAAQGLRLPSASEWTLAAGSAPITGDSLAYPWGATYEVQRANTLESGFGRPTPVGNYSPAGDSPIGAADIGGNVAEWTMSTRDDGTTRVVKGGSYRESSAATRVDAEQNVAANGYGDWIGFRCVRPDKRS